MGDCGVGWANRAGRELKGPALAKTGLERGTPICSFVGQATRHPNSQFMGRALGFGFTDEGMGLFLSGYYGAPPNLSWGVMLPSFEGKFQTSTVRDAAQIPYPGFVKAYMHNGYLTSLKEVVHFYNTRDVYPYSVLSGNCPKGTVEKVTCWPMPEDFNNENTTIGKLGLTSAEEDDIVAFLNTLVDGYVP